jgi:serine protease Do
MKRNAVAWVAVILSAAALASSQGLYRPAPAAQEIPAEGQRAAKALSEAFEAVADYVKPSVVSIKVERKAGNILGFGNNRGPRQMPNPRNMDPKDLDDMLKELRKFFGPGFGPEQEQFGRAEGTGSGFVYDDKGHILTNNHVVNGAEKIVVTFHDGTEAPATVVGTDPATDVAVIKVENSSYKPVRKGQSNKLRVGEWVLAFGSPFGLDQTVTAGIVSATERNDLDINDFESFIQTDAAINPGNSGGPLVDLYGRVVGINSAIVTGNRTFVGAGSNSGVGFAIPIDMAAPLADKLIKDGKVNRARLGIALGVLTPALAKQFGLDPQTKGTLVAGVVDGSPADKAGVQQGDIITKFDGKPTPNARTLKSLAAASDVGKSYELTYLRDGKEQTVKVVPAPEDQVVFETERQQGRGEDRQATPRAARGEIGEFGLSVQPLTPSLADQFGFKKGVQGLVVTNVKDGSPAEAAGLEVGNLITKVVKDRRPQDVGSVKDLQDLASKSDELAVFVQNAEGAGTFRTLSKDKKD